MRSDNRKLIILSVAMPLGIALLPIIACLLAGCAAVSAAPAVSDYDLSTYKATVAMSAASLDSPDGPPGPTPPGPKPKVPRSQCKVCNGTGKCRSGDGLLVWDCTACEPDAKASLGSTEEIPFGTVTYHRDSIGNAPPADAVELAEEKPARKATGPEWTLRAKAPVCDCQATGLCTCGDSCTCAGPRTRIAYLYTTAGCRPCQRAKEAIAAAAKDGRLPGDIRVVVRTESPSWVREFPTIHFAASGIWVKTHDVNTFLRDCNGLKAGLASEAALSGGVTSFDSGCSSGACVSGGLLGGSCSSGSCFGGSCFGGGCSSGSCGGFSQPTYGWSSPSWGGGWSGGWGGGFGRGFSSGGGGCVNCGR